MPRDMAVAERRDSPYERSKLPGCAGVAHRLQPHCRGSVALALSVARAVPARSRALEGILCIEAGMLLFVLQDGMMKAMIGAFPIWQLIFARAVVALLLLTPLILWLGRPHRLLTPLWPWHLARALLFTSGFSLFYAAFPFMGLAEVTTIFFAAPLITAALAAVWLGEHIGPYRLGALLVGFAGVVIAMNPGGETFSWVALLPLACAATYATSQVIVRRIGEQETTLTIGLYTIGLSGVLILPIGWSAATLFGLGEVYPHLAWNWSLASWQDAGLLALLGTAGMLGYMLLSRAYQVANASLVAPFDYTYLPMVALMAYLVWGEMPGTTTFVGMALIVGSGLYLGHRELKAARRREEPAPTAEATFTPGNPVAPLSIPKDVGDS